MPLSRISNMLLYVPFTHEYDIPISVQVKLTKDEFFKFCYVSPDFEKNIEEIRRMTKSEIDEKEYPINQEDMIKMIRNERKEWRRFNDWVKEKKGGIYCILGDAGTGKTTYLHHLQWEDRNNKWEIIDIQKADELVEVFGNEIIFENFSSLHGKALSAVFIEFINLIFPQDDKSLYKIDECYQNIRTILKKYKKDVSIYIPNHKFDSLYEQLNEVKIGFFTSKRKQEYCKKCASIIINYFARYYADAYVDKEHTRKALDCALIHLLIAYRCLEEVQSMVIVIDNLERFIGVHEIFNDELIDFIANLRGFSDTQSTRFTDTNNVNHFALHYQFAVAMRNTSVRNFTPQQNADFFEHSVDISDWFPVDEIISKKIEWYNNNNVSLEDNGKLEHLSYILKDFGLTKSNIIRGLRPKINLIFNYNKRLVVEYLVDLLDPDEDIKALEISNILELSNNFMTLAVEGNESIQPLARFAYRSIIWRLVFDKLHDGGLFANIFAAYSSKEHRDNEIEYVRKILTILSNYSLANGKSYMPFSELIELCFNQSGRLSTWFYDNSYKTKRKCIAQALYFMNYYNRRDNNWFQFVDIQYNVSAYNKKRLTSVDSLLTLIEDAKDSPDNINIRITNAGKAYLGYVVQSFEFISCIGKKYDPLLCCFPTEYELMDRNADDLQCVRVINEVLKDSISYVKLSVSDKNNPALAYKKKIDNPGYIYTKRLVQSHIGYLDNFCECIDIFIASDNEEIMKKKRKLIGKIRDLRNYFRNSYLSLENTPENTN